MRNSVRPALLALGIAGVSAATLVAASDSAFAQAKQAPAQQQTAPQQAAPQEAPPLKQIALTDKQVDGVIASQKDMDAITDKIPENSQPDAKVLSQLDDVAKKNGFASYDEYNNVIENISLVLSGFDPQTKKYIGPEAVLKQQIAQVQADKKMPAKDKKAALDQMNAALKSPPPNVDNKGNIDLITKYYDKLAAIMQDDQ